MGTGRHIAAQTDFISDISTAEVPAEQGERGSMPNPSPPAPDGPLRMGSGLDQFLLLHLKHWGWRAQGWPCFRPLMSSVQCNDFCEGIQFLSPSPWEWNPSYWEVAQGT